MGAGAIIEKKTQYDKGNLMKEAVPPSLPSSPHTHHIRAASHFPNFPHIHPLCLSLALRAHCARREPNLLHSVREREREGE